MYGPSRAADIQYTANPPHQQIPDFQQILTFAVVQLHDLLGRLHHIRHHHGHTARRAARTHTVKAVLQHQAVIRVEVQLFRRQQKRVGCGLAVG